MVIARKGDVCPAGAGFTQNISSCGVLFTATEAPDLGTHIEFVITLGHGHGPHVDIRCVGKVVRFEPAPDQPACYNVAATLERYEFVRAN